MYGLGAHTGKGASFLTLCMAPLTSAWPPSPLHGHSELCMAPLNLNLEEEEVTGPDGGKNWSQCSSLVSDL